MRPFCLSGETTGKEDPWSALKNGLPAALSELTDGTIDKNGGKLKFKQTGSITLIATAKNSRGVTVTHEIKEEKSMSLFKNRTVVGVICILLSLLICFGVTPLFNKSVSQKTEIVRVVKEIKAGDEISKEMVQTVEVGGFGLPENVLRQSETVVGKYATADLSVGDYILNTKLSDTPAAENTYLYNLDGTKQAMVFEPRKEFIVMVILVIGNIPLLYFLNQDWYRTLMHTPLGQVVLAICAAVIFISTAFVIKLTQPIEYRR